MNLGLKKLIDNSEIFTKITSYDLGFLIGPKINAGGRLGFSSYGSELLSANDESTAEILSIKLNQLNEKRKKIEKIHLDEIYLEAEKHKKDPVLVLFKPDWHEGIIGIIASRIKDKFYKPTIIITGLKNTLKASARSVFGFNIGSLIQICLKKTSVMNFFERVRSFLFFSLKSIKYAINEKNVDMIYATSTPLTVAIPTLFRKTIKRTPYIFEVRDLWREGPIQMNVIQNKFYHLKRELLKCDS